MRDLLGHLSSTECLQEIILLNVISHSSTPQAGAPSFFSKTISVDFTVWKTAYFPPQGFPVKFWPLVHPAGLQCPPSSIILSHLPNHLAQSCNWVVSAGDLSACLNLFCCSLWCLPICSTCTWWETLKCTQQIRVEFQGEYKIFFVNKILDRFSHELCWKRHFN